MQNKVCIEGIRTYSFHGCMEAEAAVGSLYSTDVTVETDFMEAARADDLTGTVDYGRIALIVRQEMDIRSRLVENVAYRIYTAVHREFPQAGKVTVCVAKLSPPVEGRADRAFVEIGD